jgi:hypothetical protein
MKITRSRIREMIREALQNVKASKWLGRRRIIFKF